MSNIFRDRLDLSPISGEPIMEDEYGDSCFITLPGSALTPGDYNVSLPIDDEVESDGHAARIKVGDADSGFIQGVGAHNFQLTVTSGSEIKITLSGVRVRLSQVSVELAA